MKKIFFFLWVMAVAIGWGQATVFNVTTTQDNVPGSLRAAITMANANGANNTIYLPVGTYILSGTANEDNNLGGDLDINTTKSLTIIGAGSPTTIIDGNQIDRVLHVLKGTVLISGVTIQKGKTSDGIHDKEKGVDGGGIYNSGTLSLTGCTIKDNASGNGYADNFSPRSCPGGGGWGGGIYNTGSLTLSGCTVTNNNAGKPGNFMNICEHVYGGFGGGICNMSSGNIVLKNCVISHNHSGNSPSPGIAVNPGGEGGGIFTAGTQELSDCTIEYNYTGWFGYGGNGGGISNRGNSTITKCIIQFNGTGESVPWWEFKGSGGGIYNSKTLVLTDCTIRNNFVSAKGDGGGICNNEENQNDVVKATITRCTIFNNNTDTDNSGGSGGGIFSNANLSLTNCTISDNYSGCFGNGGGICGSVPLTITNCTICYNYVYTYDGRIGTESLNGETGCGGGIYGTADVTNTIIAHNYLHSYQRGPDVYGTLYSHGYNLITTTEDYLIEGVDTGNILGVDPKLGPLADNGGRTQTRALLAGSPAIDKGNSPGLSKDQRGYTRPVDIAVIPNAGDGSDIGAYEYNPTASISGKITYGGTGFAGVKLTGSNNGGFTTTDSAGNYTLKVASLWSGTVTPAQSGYTFTPAIRTYTNVGTDITEQNYTGLPTVASQISLNRTQLNFGAKKGDNTTLSQSFSIANVGGGVLRCTLSSNAYWLNLSQTTVIQDGVVTVTVSPEGLIPGTYAPHIDIEDPGALNSPQRVLVTLEIYDPNSVIPPFGSFDTPVDGATVFGSVPVTGWALDNIAIESVKIYRDPVPGEGSERIYIDDTTFVEGSRPDLETSFPDYPNNYQAGWGYMLLTNMLPNQGNGSFRIYAEATDREGNVVTLGSKTIICDNAHAVLPFGAIDTPAEGGTVSGANYVNFGWALTPLPNTIATNGSTILVWVDGLPVNHPVYNQYRVDIATLFPGYNNSNGAVGYLYLDTRKYKNGVHTIAWSVKDNVGNEAGIGSRYFTVQNATSSDEVALKVYPAGMDALEFIEENDEVTHLEIKELERLAINLFEQQGFESQPEFSGYLVLGEQFRSLPIGSSLDRQKGIFYWQPGPGFVGEYEFIFIARDSNGDMRGQRMMVKITPKFTKEN